MVLVKAVQDALASDSEFHRRSLQLVGDVCSAIYRQGQSIREELLDDQQQLKYLSGPGQRTVDIVPNTSASYILPKDLLVLGSLLSLSALGEICGSTPFACSGQFSHRTIASMLDRLLSLVALLRRVTV